MGTSPTLGEEFEKNSPPGLGGVAKAEGGMVGDLKLIIPLCPMGTSPILGEELEKNLSSAAGGGGALSCATPPKI